MNAPSVAPPMIEAIDLGKRFGDFEAVSGISFGIAKGSCIGLLGPNGAGKTTTMRMIMGLTRRTSGTLTLFGRDVADMDRSVRSRIGLVPQENNLDPDLSVRDNLQVYGRYYGLKLDEFGPRIGKLLQFVSLEEKVEARVGQLSGGMKRRLVIARALISEPDLVILDEPTTGLDPQARVMIWRQLGKLKAEGKTLLLTTHYMDEAERLCDRIIVIDHGRILDEDTPQGLIRRHVRREIIEFPKPLPGSLGLDGLEHEDLGNAVLVFTDEAHALLRTLPEGTPHFLRPANLEDVFLRLTGRILRER